MLKAQENNGVLLSNYTFSEKGKDVALIYPVAHNRIINLTLKGKDAEAFRVSKNKLLLKRGFNKSDKLWYDILIEAETSAGNFESSFRIVNDAFLKNKVIAHRGAWKNTGATENSLASLKNAIKLGCEGTEFDVHLTADSVLVIHHDPHIESFTIEKSTWKNQLSEVKLSNEETLPLLDTYLQEGTSQNKTKLILEIKPSVVSAERGIETARATVALVRKMRAQAWIDYISFDYNICLEILKLDPFARVAYLKGDKSPEILSKDGLWGLDYHFDVFKKHPDWIELAKKRGLTINTWTVNDPVLMQFFLNKKVDFITTNEPEQLLKMTGNEKH